MNEFFPYNYMHIYTSPFSAAIFAHQRFLHVLDSKSSVEHETIIFFQIYVGQICFHHNLEKKITIYVFMF